MLKNLKIKVKILDKKNLKIAHSAAVVASLRAADHENWTNTFYSSGRKQSHDESLMGHAVHTKLMKKFVSSFLCNNGRTRLEPAPP